MAEKNPGSIGIPPMPADEVVARAEQYEVVCEDGHIRHRDPFDWISDAQHFAEWGHCCTRNHEIRVKETP